MIRKLQKSRRLSFVSLPSDWVKQHNLSQGSKLEVNLVGSDLIISLGELVREKKIELDISSDKVEPLVQLVRACFISGATEITINLLNKLSDAKVKLLRKEIKGFYGIHMVEVSDSVIKMLVATQTRDLKNLSKMLISSTINAVRSLLNNDLEMVNNHVEQAQLYRHVIRRSINLLRKDLSWNLIAENFGVITHVIQEEYGKKGVTKDFFEQVLKYLQKLDKPGLKLNDLLRIYFEVRSLKQLIEAGGSRYFKLDRAYRALYSIIRELITITVE